MSQTIVPKKRLKLVKSVEVLLDIPDTEDKQWANAGIFGIAGCFHTEFPELFIDFGGYIKVLLNGSCRGMITDIFGDAVILGKLSPDRKTMKFSKIYCVYLSNRTAQQPLTYNLKSEDTQNFKGKWYDDPEFTNAGSEVVCSIYATGITVESFRFDIQATEEEEAIRYHHEEYLALTNSEDE